MNQIVKKTHFHGAPAKTMHDQAKNSLQDKISNAKLEFNFLIRIIRIIANP